MIRYQRTLSSSISCEGIGLHSGKPVRMTLRPAPIGTGIVFIRTDLENAEVRAVAANTATTGYATTLSQNGVTIQTVEHLLAAFAGLNIDNVHVEIDSDEVPIMDGSARPLAKIIIEAGIENQKALQPVIKIIKPVFVREGTKQLAIWPAETASVTCFIDFNHPLLQDQSLSYQPSEEAFLREVSGARTFGFLSDVKTLQANGLAKGASLENAIALDEESVVNEEGLRYKDEFVRHKILDIIGDMFLAGMPIIGHIVAHKSGHALNAQMVSKLLNSTQNWITVGSFEHREVEAAPQFQHAAL